MKTILASLLGTAADERVLEASYRLAIPFNAHIDALHVRPDPAQIIAASAAGPEMAMSLGAISGSMWESILESNRKIAKDAHQNFQTFLGKYDLRLQHLPDSISRVSGGWTEIEGEYTQAVSTIGRLHEIVVLGDLSDNGAFLPEIGSILIGCGRPLLIVPKTVREELFTTVAIAWKDTAEAARAVTAAMPLLRHANRVIVLTVSEDEMGGQAEASAQNLADQLRWHGFKVAAHHVSPDNLAPAEALMGVARDMGAELLVMGGYGHSRAFEFLFGGFTKYVLANATIPVLMAH